MVYICPGGNCTGIAIFFFDKVSHLKHPSAGIWVLHSGPKSGGELVTLFDSYCNDGVSAGIWVIESGPKSGAS